ncbi:alpha/beta fold hydrolase [Streptomyces sp. ISL-1]|uniref:alpha/beta fold hydrolase n=1 Tax=Streptomyces sp. ISL-1 TaxID=2817657 RepID=UPI001BEC5AE9|nr:alpha/beta fold hydrolase [Streptomyces sp. ISL-1]MBT2388394.1 alpha/beta fold hydrolase [Streptomyces sp. ISL-1]
MRTSESSADVLREFRRQQPKWSPSPSGDGSEQCVVEVPLDHARPDGPRLSIAVNRIRAKDPGRRRGILLALNGGPGGYFGLGRRFPAVLSRTRLGECYDLIGFDPRGTGGSTPLTGEITPTKAPFDSRPTDADFPLVAEDFRRREEGNQRAGGEPRRHHSTRNVARDMEVIREVLGEEKLSFIGYTYGTYVGAVYGSMFPSRLDRCVLDSCVHPDWSWREQFMAQGRANRANVEKWADWAAERVGLFGLGATQDAVISAVEEAAHNTATQAGNYLRTLFDGAMGSRSANRARWAELGHLVADLRTGDKATVEKWLADEKVWPPAETEGTTRCGVLDAVTLEKDWPEDLDVYFEDMRRFRERYPYGYGVMRAQPWVGAFRAFTPPEEPASLTGEGLATGLVVHADGDPTDHYEGGAAMAARLGYRLITVADSGQHEIYALNGNPEVDALVDAYLVDGIVPEDTVCTSTVRRPDIPADRAGDTERPADHTA